MPNPVDIYIYIEINSSANEFECGILGFYFIQLCSARVSDFMVFFKRLIMNMVVLIFSFYKEDCFDIYIYI